MKICQKNNILFGCKSPLQIEPKSIHQISKKERALIGQGEAYIRSYLKKESSIPALQAIGIDPKTMKINLHFLFRLITRMQQNRIFKMRSLVDALENGQIFKQENFHGFIIKGSNGLIIILKKLGHKKASLDSIYTAEKKFPNWTEFATYAKTAKNDFVE